MHALDEAWSTIRREFDSACSQVTRAARAQITNELNQCLRRLRQYSTEAEWISATIDGASRFAQQVAVFTLAGGKLSLRGQNRLPLPKEFSFESSSAAAFANAIESGDPVVALRSVSEVTQPLSSEDPADRAHILPINNGPRVAAVLFAAGSDYLDINALELIAGLASVVLERQSNLSLHTQIAPPLGNRAEPEEDPTQGIAKPVEVESKPGAMPVHPPAKLPAWADLSEVDRALHVRAQRFSRVAIAEMQLANPEASRAGREQSNLYVFLKKEIDAARERYRHTFMTTPSMVDYLHLELVRAVADGDERKLGADYPGQMA